MTVHFCRSVGFAGNRSKPALERTRDTGLVHRHGFEIVTAPRARFERAPDRRSNIPVCTTPSGKAG